MSSEISAPQPKPRRPRPPKIDTIAREPRVAVGPEDTMLPEVSAKDLAVAASMAKEDERIRQGLVKLGGTPQEAELSVDFAAFQARHLAAMVGLTSSGVALNFQRELGVMRDLEGKLREGFDKGQAYEEMDILLRHYTDLAEESRKTAEMCQRTSILLAKIEAQKQAAAANGQKVRAKPGFKPKGDVNVIAQNVTLNPK